MAADKRILMPPMMRILGYAGLTPFLLLPLFHWQQWWLSEPRISVLFQFYSCLILGFMAGVLWPVLYKSDQPTRRAIWGGERCCDEFSGIRFIGGFGVANPGSLVFEPAGLRSLCGAGPGLPLWLCQVKKSVERSGNTLSSVDVLAVLMSLP